MQTLNSNKKFWAMFSLVIAGEAVFFLPFVMARIFRPTLLDFFNISNTELGVYFSIYGVVAMISYVFGGVLADRFQARKLMASALWLTAFAGLLIGFFPSKGLLGLIYGFWGFTSIFLFWAAMIRATREWGGNSLQGRAFGLLEGGRGATAALLGTITFIIFSQLSVEQAKGTLDQSGFHPFQFVILSTSLLTLFSGFLVWFLVPDSDQLQAEKSVKTLFTNLNSLVGKPGIWMLSLMIICAYVGYKVTDDFSLYAREVLGFSESGAAGLGTSALWLRAIVAIIAGFLGDRFNKSGLISILFFLSLISGCFIALGWWSHHMLLILLNFGFVAIGIYGVRALYFAILREARVNVLLTGSAVGIVSFIGYTPDIFMGPWMGYLLDNNPGEKGHQLIFWLLAGFSLVGLITSIFFNLYSAKVNR